MDIVQNITSNNDLRSSFMLFDDKLNLILFIKYMIDVLTSGFDIANTDMLYVQILTSDDVDLINSLEQYLKYKKKLDLHVHEVIEYINEYGTDN